MGNDLHCCKAPNVMSSHLVVSNKELALNACILVVIGHNFKLHSVMRDCTKHVIETHVIMKYIIFVYCQCLSRARLDAKTANIIWLISMQKDSTLVNRPTC